MENYRKEKVIKILKRVGIVISLAFNFIFVIALIIGSQGNKKHSSNIQVACAESEVIEFKQESKKLVSYDDENYVITLSVDEVNNYTWENLGYYLDNLYPWDVLESTSFDYGELNFPFTDLYLAGYAIYENGDYNIFFGLDFTEPTYCKFVYRDNSGDELLILPFNDNLIWNLSSGCYSNIKSAIELDIQANYVEPQSINDGVFETLTESTVGFIGVIGSGIVNMTAIFYDSANSQLTTIGLLSVIVVAISLSYFLFRLIIGLIRMRG